MKYLPAYLFLLVMITFSSSGCKVYKFRSAYTQANELIHSTDNREPLPYLKAHMKNGNVYILTNQWEIDTTKNLVSGDGTLYDFNRTFISKGKQIVRIDSVAIFETNKVIQPHEGNRIAALSILTGVDVTLGIICFVVPKACFGSCPTFYINQNDNFHYADAEGFSNAISPALEYTDIDALNYTTSGTDTFCITMKNEAQETHCVNDVSLLAYPVNAGEYVFQTPDQQFYLCKEIQPLKQASSTKEDITHELRYNDREEWFSLANANNLSSKEELFLNFDNPDTSENLGLILNFRQSLMTTYFIYSGLDYMGNQAGDIFAKIENGSEVSIKLRNGIKKELGNIQVFLWDEQQKSWIEKEGFYETGPIAYNKQMTLLGRHPAGQPVKLKIVVNKGLWRLNYAALTHVLHPVSPVILKPDKIVKNDKENKQALADLRSDKNYLISMTGDTYKLHFNLPDSTHDYELFLSATGYYLEWMRSHWLKEKNLPKLRQMLHNPRKYLRTEAKAYKQYEATMEEQFWNSKIESNPFTLYEK